MRWNSLGHAGWLVEASNIRILCDPLLGDLLHGGIHRVHPPRRVHVEQLRPDLLVISHAHPDHFDVPSLATLLRESPELPVLTADPLVARAAVALGARSASVLSPDRRLDLGPIRLLTTRSTGVPDEWGIAICDDSALAWNQVDSVLAPADVRAVRGGLARSLSPRGARLDLVLAHWCPLREVQLSLADSPGFPFEAWAEKLAAIAALEAPIVVPAAAGFRHVPPFDWRDAYVFPATEQRLATDLAALAPETRVEILLPGDSIDIDRGASAITRGGPLCTAELVPPVRPFSPLSAPPVSDPALGGERTEAIRAAVGPWVEGPLALAVARESERLGLYRPPRLALEIVYPDDRDIYSLVGSTARKSPSGEIDPEYDALVTVAGSMLADVIAGRRHWGEPLLAGLMRSVRRVRPMPAFFLYWALSYRSSVERWVDHQVAAALAR